MKKHRLAVLAGAGAFAISAMGTSSCDSTSSSSSTKASPSQSSAPSSSTSASKPKVHAKTQYFSGAGDKNLGTIVVPVDSTLIWDNGKDLLGGKSNFVITNDYGDDNTIDANAIGTHDSTQVAAGTYHKVEVIGTKWRFKIVPHSR